MQLLQQFTDLPAAACQGAVAIGNFDGVHRGHTALLERLVGCARNHGGAAVVFTFSPHPVQLLRPAVAPPPLTWLERKAELLGEFGVDYVIAYPTDTTLLSLTPAEFFTRVLVDRLQARAIVEGPNFCFGKDRTGDVNLLGQLAAAAGIELQIVTAVEGDGVTISSSQIRQRIAAGDIAAANRMLTRPYRIRGAVVRGAQRGRLLGFPTANLDAIDTLRPGPGVYAGRAWVAGHPWPAAIHVGPLPTFADPNPRIEVHLIRFDGSLYGTRLEVDFLGRLRDIQSFGDREALIAQLQADVQAAEHWDHPSAP